MTMNLKLAELYGTPGAPASEDQTKLAEATLFSKLSAEQGIDLSSLSDDQVQYLWDEVMTEKSAGENPFPPKDDDKDEKKDDDKKDDDEKKDEEKKEAAAREHAVKLAHVEEENRAAYLGQVMAHSYVSELSKIAAANEPAAVETPADGTKEAGMPPQLAAALGKVKGVAGAAGGKAKDLASKGVAAVKANPGKAAGGAAAVAGGAGFMAGRASKKEASAGLSPLDQLALEAAVKIAHAGGFDPEEAAERVMHVAGLGLQESTKVASTVDEQIEVRALEYLEVAGYPVEWK